MTTLSQRISYNIERPSKATNNILCLTSKAHEVELVCHISEQFCQSNFSDIHANNTLTFHFDKDYLTTFGKSTLNLPDYIEKELCFNSKLIVFDILKTKFNGNFKNMFIESKAIELLLCIFDCETAIEDRCSSCKFLMNPYEKEKIYAAREILLNNIDNPPIISELATQVGINQCYLKKGFKDVYDTSIYAFVQEQRIVKAKLLLKNSNNSIAEIAEIVGFSNPSNFSNAFKNYTGILPSELRNN